MKTIFFDYSIYLLLVSKFLFNISLIVAQSDYREGYIINNNLDTIHGFINNNADLFHICKFKNKLTEEAIIFKPTEINGFRFKNDKYFLSKEVKLKNDYDLYGDVFIKESTTSRNDFIVTRVWYPDSSYYFENVFAEFLLKGKINVYYCIDIKNREHYFLEKSDSLYDLTSQVFKTFHHGTLYGSMDRKKYIPEIASVMSDAPDMHHEIQNSGLNHKDLVKLGKDYHKYICNDDNCIIYAKPLQKVNFNFGLFFGFGYSNLSYLYTEGNLNPKFSDQSSMHIGSSLHLRHISTEMEKMSLKLTIDYWESNYKSKFYTNTNGWANLAFNANNLLVSLQLVNNISTYLISPYYEVGFDLLSSFNESFIDEEYYRGRILITSFTPKRVGINLGLGTEISLFNKRSQLFVEIIHHQMIRQFITNIIIGYEF